MSEGRGTPLLAVRGLHKHYRLEGRDIHVLRGVSFELERGELVSLAGKSGVGKSTLLHVVGTLDEPTSGQVFYEGLDVFALRERELAAFRNRSLGFVFQFHHLLPEFTALENAMMPALIAGLARKEAARRAREMLERVGLAERLDHRPGELSGGEQQRVAIARALVMRPALVLADEPTGNLDGQTSDGIHALILELNRELGVTFLVATHNFSLALLMQRHLLLDDGVVTELTREEAGQRAEAWRRGRGV